MKVENFVTLNADEIYEQEKNGNTRDDAILKAAAIKGASAAQNYDSIAAAAKAAREEAKERKGGEDEKILIIGVTLVVQEWAKIPEDRA